MYAGHVGFALGAYSFRRTLPLWLIILAAQIPDWLDAGMCIADVSRGPNGLYSHGLVTLGAAAVVFAGLTWVVTRDLTGALIMAIVVLSHYGLDYLTGLKPTWAGGPVIGLSLYSRPVIDVVMETATVLVGWLLYRRTIPRPSRNGGLVYLVLLALIALQLVAGLAFVMNLGSHVKC